MGIDRGIAPDNLDVFRSCAKCGKRKAGSDFHRSRTGRFSYCGDCRRAYDRRYYAERGKEARLARVKVWRGEARAWMAALKEGRACADCGGVFAPFVMHWDHLPGHLKVAEVSAMVGNRRRDVVIEELAKCELVCANCHVIRTVRRARRTIAEEPAGYQYSVVSTA
ncbi:MAG TPA: hypothetical protein VGT60_08055 [Candidatus Limnocylindria bacterium]|nr:hypothetical protein [Candidatus Limnocylindria bacterium]